MEKNQSFSILYMIMKLTVQTFETIEYDESLRLQNDLNFKRQNEKISDTLLLLEHPPVLTLGRNGKPEDILLSKEVLKKNHVQIHTISRGGDVTYHGPGQIVGYTIIHLYREEKSLRKFVEKLEQVIINLLSDEYGINADRHPKHRGIWIGDKKIAAIGISVHHGVTKHGFALNVQPDLSHFNWIIPCGIPDRGVTSLKEQLGKTLDLNLVRKQCINHFAKVFDYTEIEIIQG